MGFLLNILYFAIIVGILVFVHELGHFLAARLFRVKVTQFAIGVGPRMTGFERKGTEFRIGWLPLGGYVLMAQHPDDGDDEQRALLDAPRWQRAAIALAGPLFSLAFPILCYLAVGLGTSTVPAPHLAYVGEDSPAAEAGLQPGDTILAVDGDPLTYWHELEDAIISSEGHPIAVTVGRDDTQLELLVRPERRAGDPTPKLGVWHTTPANAADDQPRFETQRVDFPLADRIPYAAGYAVEQPLRVSAMVLYKLGGMVTGEVPTTELGGPILIFDVAGRAGDAGLSAFLILMAIISVNLGLINLLPIPVLDGGRLMLIAIEAIQRRPLSMRTQQITAMVGIAMVVALMVLAFKNDIERYWSMM